MGKVPVDSFRSLRKEAPFHEGIEALGPMMWRNRPKEHAQFPNGMGQTGTTQLAHKRFCCQNMRVDEGLVRTPDKRMAQVRSCTLAGQNDQMAFSLMLEIQR